jgi:hypothetical protein
MQEKAQQFPTTFCRFPCEFWTPVERLRCSGFADSFRYTAKQAMIGLCPQRLAFNADTTIVFEILFRPLVT